MHSLLETVAAVGPEEMFNQLTVVSSEQKSLKEKTLGQGFANSRLDDSSL